MANKNSFQCIFLKHILINELIFNYIQITACKNYNLSIHCDHDQCHMLHICEEKLLNSNCPNKNCKLNHTLKFFQTKKILENLNLNGDHGLILSFFQVKFKLNPYRIS